MSQHVTYHYRRGAAPLTEPQLRRIVPSAFTDERYGETTSERFAVIPTAQLVTALAREGFAPVDAAQTRTRDDERAGYTRHMIAFRMPDSPLMRAWSGEIEPRLLMLNAHDGASAYQLHFGMFRFWCSNKHVTGDELVKPIRVRHLGGAAVIDAVIAGSLELAGALPLLLDELERWRSTPVPLDAQIAYAESALMLRYDGDERPAPVPAAALLRPRRTADTPSDVYHVYNRVQECLTRGINKASAQRAARGATGMRGVRGITQDVKLNKALWHLTSALERQLNGRTAPAVNVIEGEIVG